MVFFTCNHCGESVKKPSVEKHYNTKCRGAKKSISCMDCQKDFNDDYVKHTKCITELQKYSGKDYVARESPNSGAKKQEGWVGVVHSILDSQEYNLSEKSRRAFEVLKNYDNVPRKKAKFLNFVTNSVHIPRQTVEDVWIILEKEQEKLKKARQAELAAEKESKSKKGADKVKDDKIDAEESGEKKKKKKDRKNSENLSEEKTNGDVAEKKKKEKKKKGSISEDAPETEETPLTNGIDKKKKNSSKNEETEDLHQNNEDLSEVKKKKKQKKQKEDAETDEVEAPPSKKQKKSKINTDEDAEIVNGDKSETNDEAPTKKKLKKKHEINGNEETEEPVNKKQKVVENGTENAKKKKAKGVSEELNQTKDSSEFSWVDELDRVAEKYPEGITLEKLRKKLSKKYAVKIGVETLDERQQKGFERKLDKKLKACATLKMEGDIIRAVS